MAVAQTIADSLLTELNRYSAEGTKPDPFTTARLRRSIEKLSKVDHVGGLLCEAILLTFENQYALVVDKFEEIFKFLPEDADMHENFGNSLGRLNHMWEAQDQYNEALRFSRDPASIIKEMAKSSCITFRIHDVMRALEQIEDPELREKLIESQDVADALELNTYIEEAGVTSHDVSSIYYHAERVCHEYNKSVPLGYLQLTSQFSGPNLTLYAEVDGSATDIANMNFALCDILIDADLGTLFDKVSYVFIADSKEKQTGESKDKQTGTDLQHAHY